MEKIKDFFKGVLGGIGNIVPGLSGSALLIIIGIYENAIDAISNIFKNFKKSFLYLLPIGLGILVGTFLFSNIIEFSINKFPMATSIIFVGFLIGTIPSLFKQATKKGFKWSYLISFMIAFILGVLLLFFKENSNVSEITFNFNGIIKLISMGILLACSTIIPGISSTVLLSMFGLYGIYLHAINTLNIKLLIPVLLGLAIGGFILSKIINYLLKKQYGYTFFAIVGFTVSTIPALFTTQLIFNLELIIGIIIAIIAFAITSFTLNISK